MADTRDNSQSQSPQTDVWKEWKDRIGTLRSALESKLADKDISELTSGCLDLYKNSYNKSKQCSADEALASISGRDCSPLEIAFMWLGGWRPTSAITLVYSTLSAAYRVTDGVAATPSILSHEQLQAIKTLQKFTQEIEVDLSRQLADLQMLIPDQSMVEALIVDATSLLGEKNWKKGRELMEIKVEALANLFIQANKLRLQTLEVLISLLNPVQRAQCCISAFEIVHAVKEMR